MQTNQDVPAGMLEELLGANHEITQKFAGKSAAEANQLEQEILNPPDEDEEAPEADDDAETLETAEPEVEAEAEETEVEVEAEQPRKQTKGERRFQKLSNENRALREQVAVQNAQYQQQMSQYVAQMQQQHQAQLAAVQQQNQILQQQWQAQQKKLSKEEFEKLDAFGQLEHLMAQRMEQAIAPKLASVEQRLAAEQQERQKLIEQQKHAKAAHSIEQEVKKLSSETLVPGADADLQDLTEELLLTYAINTGELQPAVKGLSQFIDKVVAYRMRQSAKKTNPKLAASSKTTSVSGRSTGTKGKADPNYRPSEAALIAAGYGNNLWVDWRRAGAPVLPEPARK